MKRNPWAKVSSGIWLILPLVLFSSFFLIYPLVNTIFISFYDQRIIGTQAPYVGFALYKKLLTSRDTFTALTKSFIWTFGNVIINNSIAIMFALVLFCKLKGHIALESIILIPWIIPGVVAAVIWRFMLHPTLGVVNHILMKLHFITKPLLFLADKSQAMGTIIGVNVWTFFGLRTLIILAALVGISKELFEAAKVDGANGIQRFMHIILPAIKPVLSVVILLGGFQTFNKVAIIWLFTRGGPGDATMTLPLLIYQKAYMTWRSSEAAVLSVIMAIILAIVAAIYFRINPDEEIE